MVKAPAGAAGTILTKVLAGPAQISFPAADSDPGSGPSSSEEAASGSSKTYPAGCTTKTTTSSERPLLFFLPLKHRGMSDVSTW